MLDHIILYPATWILDQEMIKNISSMYLPDRVKALKELCENRNWPRYIALTEFDNQLIFDLKEEEDWDQLAYCFKEQNSLKIQEYYLDKNGALIHDEVESPYTHELICPLYHKESIYPKISIPTIHEQAQIKSQFVPGSEWLYYKLYIHSSRANAMIKDNLIPVINKLKKQGLITHWFLVRYNDPDFHLRVRFKIHPKHSGHILTQLERRLSIMAYTGVINRYNIGTYTREIERYKPHLISLCEQHFCKSTELVVWWLSTTDFLDSNIFYYQPCFSGIITIVREFGYAEMEITAIFEQLYFSMDDRLQFNRSIRKSIQKSYRSQKTTIKSYFDINESNKTFSGFVTSIKELSKASMSLSYKDRQQLCVDLIHMHLNRLLTSNSLFQEAIIYYSVWQIYRSKIARASLY